MYIAKYLSSFDEVVVVDTLILHSKLGMKNY